MLVHCDRVSWRHAPRWGRPTAAARRAARPRADHRGPTRGQRDLPPDRGSRHAADRYPVTIERSDRGGCGIVEHARAVVIGGGVGGTSIAYHLAELGWTDIVLVDRAELTSGSTFHSAGLVGQLRSSVTLTRMMMYGADLYRRLTAETGTDVSWHEVGSLRLASTVARYEELQRQAAWATTFGLPLELISAQEAQDRFPLMSTDGVLGAVWLPTDGWLDPSGLAMALAAGARARGAAIRTHSRVVGIGVDGGRVTGVQVELRDGSREAIRADVVVNAGGMFAPEIGRLAGVTVPIIPMAHQYLFTEAIEGVDPGLPQLRDPDNFVYFREEVGGLCMGGYERDPAPWSLDGIPADFNGKLLAPDWPRFEPIMAGAVRRVPAIADAGVSRIINGPEAFTPDNEFILGESDVRGFWVAAGFSAHGIAGAGGIGRQVASWIVEGEPELDLWKMDIRRFGATYRSRDYTLARSIENYATYYDIHYPNEEREAGRPLRLSPAYGRLEALGASFGEKSGWERANWFESNAAAGDPSLRPRGWAGRHWSPAIAAEALATRSAAAIFDETSFAKIEVAGPGAAAALQRLCANDMDVPTGRIVYTQLLDRRGGIVCDLTVTRVGPEQYVLVTGTAFGNHDLGWIRRQTDGDESVLVSDITSEMVCFGLWGPRARDILASVTHDDVSNEGFPYLEARRISVGHVPVYALRVTYVGELGWELYAGMEYGPALWDTLWTAGRPHGLVAGGYRAIDALRLEKGYRVWSSDITPDETPFEAGLGFAVKLDKGVDFIGREALVAAKAAGPRKRLRCLVLDDPRSVALGNEPVRVAGRVVGRVTSGGYGFAVERSIAYAYLPPDQAAIGTRGEIDIFGTWVGSEVAREPLWDPDGTRIRS
ncbi:MAG: FAD-dependent oxidoreductase [Chloroflexi bacterium]|nr:FAD-dependent oxidoreductase [Chloroflexota bacterium]